MEPMKPELAALQTLRTALSSPQFVASLPDHQTVQNALAVLEKRLTPAPKPERPGAPRR